MTSGDLVDSVIGDGIYFDGNDDVIDCGAVNVSDTDAVTIEAWGYYDATSYWWRGFIGQNNGQNNADYGIDVSDTVNSGPGSAQSMDSGPVLPATVMVPCGVYL